MSNHMAVGAAASTACSTSKRSASTNMTVNAVVARTRRRDRMPQLFTMTFALPNPAHRFARSKVHPKQARLRRHARRGALLGNAVRRWRICVSALLAALIALVLVNAVASRAEAAVMPGTTVLLAGSPAGPRCSSSLGGPLSLTVGMFYTNVKILSIVYSATTW